MKQQTRRHAKSAFSRVTPDLEGGDFNANSPFSPPPQGPGFRRPREYHPLNDTVTEAAGLARNGAAAAPYAGAC
ncbi:hypothetical protein [Hymenobacter frigidus]|uniref:hypothetical protein n=1 Tax=Hymenobacter frigidus TaxID=1524095 RepID=UPI0016651108|nr:hypothetical protein [Hymenobacter frigidus]